MSEAREGENNAGYSQMSGGPCLEVLSWKCLHHSVYSAIHSFSPDASPEVVDQARTDLLAYYQTSQPCGCTPVITPP
jgi:hypothetical protein